MRTMERFMNTFTLQDKNVVTRQQKIPPFRTDMEEEGEVVGLHHQKLETDCFVDSFESSLEQ